MTTAQTSTQASPEPPHAGSNPATSDSRVLLAGIEWETYERLRDELDRSGCHRKLTYDGGDLEIEMPSQPHELITMFLEYFVTTYVLYKGGEAYSIGETTQKRKLVNKGLEPDLSYYVSSVEQVSQKADQPIEEMPPPDLAVEIEVTVPLVPKLPVYAGIGVSELWHVMDDGTTRILRLDGTEYAEVTTSVELPDLTADTLTYWVRRRLQGKQIETVRALHQTLAS